MEQELGSNWFNLPSGYESFRVKKQNYEQTLARNWWVWTFKFDHALVTQEIAEGVGLVLDKAGFGPLVHVVPAHYHCLQQHRSCNISPVVVPSYPLSLSLSVKPLRTKDSNVVHFPSFCDTLKSQLGHPKTITKYKNYSLHQEWINFLGGLVWPWPCVWVV